MSLPAVSILLVIMLSALQAAAEAPFKIGVVLNLSGPNSYIGVDIRDGIKICTEDPQRFLFEDSQSQPLLAVSAFNKLIELNKIGFGIVSLSNVAAAVMPLAKARKLPVAMTMVSSQSVVHLADQAVDFFTLGEEEARIFAQFAREELKVRRLALLYIESEFGLAYKEGFEKAFSGTETSLVYGNSFVFDSTDFRTLLLGAKEAKADLVYMAGFDRHIIAMLKQARELKMDSKLAAVWTISSPPFRAGNEPLFENVYCTAPAFYTQPHAGANQFIKKFLESYGREPTVYGGIGCDMAGLINRYGKESPAALITELQTLKDYQGVNGRLEAESKVISISLRPAQIKNGAITRLEAASTS